MNQNIIISVLLGMLVLSGPSGAARKRISLAAEPGIYSEADIEKEITFGREMSAIILASRRLSPDFNQNRYLNLVGHSILRHASRPELFFYFTAIESSQVNAYAAPGGYIFVTTAAIKLMKNEAELAGVLAHEIAHISERHIVEALKIRADDESTTKTLGKLIGSKAGSATVVFEQAIGQAIDILFSRGLKVEDEISADKHGILLTALAGYDPMAYFRYLQRIKPIIETDLGELSKTHPPLSERLVRIKQIIEKEGLSNIGRYLNRSRFNRYK